MKKKLSLSVLCEGNTYLSDEIEEAERTTYEKTKFEEISKLNREDKLVDMSGEDSVFNNNIYVLMDTNELYCYKTM